MSVASRLGVVAAVLTSAGAWGAPADPAQDQSREETVTLPGTAVKFDLVYLPGGKFRMGSPPGEPGRKEDEGPVRETELCPFWIGKKEVTWEEYSLFYESRKQAKIDGVTRPSQPDVVDPKEPFPNGAEQTPRHPALSIGWFGAAAYCEWLSRKTGQSYRLPTEAEWEYACRAGSDASHPDPLGDYAWYKDNSNEQTHPGAQKKPNAFGLYDMLGNAWENCLEPHSPPAFGPVVRGGAWNSPASELRHAARQTVPDDWAERDPKRPLRLWWLTDGPFVGLRVVRLPESGLGKGGEEALRAKVEVRKLVRQSGGKRPDYLARVTGEIAYTGGPALDEVEVQVYYLDEGGKPLLKDPKDKPAYNTCWPVLVNSYHEGEHRRPLRTGETRTFAVDVPHPFVETGPLDLEKVGARVSRVHAAK
jgi:formylglycine-generating enzyme required for sulfatase activity